jgi:hypothetical protein
MKKTPTVQLFALTLLFIIMGCGSGSVSSEPTVPVETSGSIPTETADESATPQSETEQASGPIDLCRCLTEPGNSQWAADNRDACNAAISKELGVENWEKVNFSKEPELNKKWDALAEMCTGSAKVKTGVKAVDKNNELVPEIGTSYGYIWESLNNEAQIYTTLAFDGLVFRSTAYAMNGQTDSENFTKVIDISGNWTAVDAQSAEGVIKANGVKVGWTFSNDYTTLTNNKGVVFQRVKVK